MSYVDSFTLAPNSIMVEGYLRNLTNHLVKLIGVDKEARHDGEK